MRDIPVDLGGYTLMIVEEPTQKTREEDGVTEFVTDSQGVALFTVALFAKQRQAGASGKRGKGEEISVTLTTDPGEEFREGQYVELVGATLSPYSFKNKKNETVSGISFRAAGLKPTA